MVFWSGVAVGVFVGFFGGVLLAVLPRMIFLHRQDRILRKALDESGQYDLE